MSLTISLGVGSSIMNMVRACALWLIAGCFGLLAPSPFLSLAWGGFPCEDVNNDGKCEPGVDNDITADIMAGYFSTANSIVIPNDAKRLSPKNVFDLSLDAGQNITVNSNLVAKGGSIYLTAGGKITVGDETTLKAGDTIDLDAQGDVVFELHASAQAGTVMLYSGEGKISLLEGSRLSAQVDVDILGFGLDGVTVSPGSQLYSPQGSVGIFTLGDVTVNGSRLVAEQISIQAADIIDFKDNVVKVPSSGGSVYFSTTGSMVDLCGTEFKKLHPDNLHIDAAKVNCPLPSP